MYYVISTFQHVQFIIRSYVARRVPNAVEAPVFWGQETEARSLKRLAKVLMAVPASASVAEMRSVEKRFFFEPPSGV